MADVTGDRSTGVSTGHVHEQYRRVPPVADIPDTHPVGSELAPSRTTEMESRPRWVGRLFPKPILFPKHISGPGDCRPTQEFDPTHLQLCGMPH